MVNKLGSLLICLVLCSLGATLVLTVLDFLMSIGPLWGLLGVGAGVIIWYKASEFET